MAGYDFLSGVRVMELAQLGPSSLGGYLGDMGAEVIKVEGRDGEPVRRSGTPAVGSEEGFGFLHLRWNRGKRSVGLDLKTDAGKDVFVRLAATCDVVIEGMRAGVLDRLGLGYDVLREGNERLVYCSISGLGRTGPYSTLGSHGPSFDAFAGISDVNPYGLSPEERADLQHTSIGMHAMGLHAALGTLAALVRARRTGQGAMIEVAACDSAAHWVPDGVDRVLNRDLLVDRPGFLNSRQRMNKWSRMFRYPTKDGRAVFFQGLGDKFWERFAAAVDRPDFVAMYADSEDIGETDEKAYVELSALFPTRTLAEWMQLFREHDVPGGPANSVEDLAADPHFVARHNVYDVDYPGVGTLHLTSTPVKTSGQDFAPTLAPEQFAHTDEVLRDVLDVTDDDLRELRAAGAIL